MASPAPPSVASTKETTNYARLCRLLVDVGSQALRDTFDGIHPPVGLHGVLARHPEHATLQTLRRKKILNPTQWGNLYPTTPSAVSSASFDVTLLMVLLRNICGLYPPVTGWDSLPLATDTSKEANIARVKYYRNTVYGHASQASVDEPTFNAYWQDISMALVALGGASYGSVINKLKIECMDPDTEEHYRELLKQWKRDEDSIKEKLDEIEVVLKQLKEEKGDIKDKLGEVEGNIKAKLDQVENQVGIEAENIKEKLQQMGNRVKDVSDKLDSLTESTQDKDKIRNDLQELKSEMASISTKMDTLMTQRQETTDEDQASDDFQQIRREIQNMAEKLNATQIFLREVTKDEGSTKDKLEEVKDEIENIKVKLDTLMNQPPSVTREPGMEDEFDPVEIIDEIRQLYKLREGWLAPFPWCEEFHFHLDDIFTRLKVVSRKKTRGTATTDTVDMSGIFKPHEECPQPRTVLIEGKPGMGKTTYCQKLVYDWATGKRDAEDCFPRFETVLLLRCRDIKSGLWEAIDDQLLPRDVKEDVKERFFDFIRHNQSNVLLILDGLDEVPATKLPMFSEIIQGRVLPKCRVVATARHEAGIRVRIHCDTLLEIEGFSNTDAWEFIYKFFKTMEDLAEKLVSKLNDDENLRQMAANPLNTALFCLLCEEFQGVFPKSRADLYVEIVRCVLRRYIQKKGLPETNEDPIEAYKPQFKHLGWIALNGLREDVLDFDESELGNYSADLPGFGFLSVQPGGSKLRPRRRYGFLHKSFQEFFAAFYLCCQLLDKEISTDSLASDRKYFHELKEVLKFTCSLLAAHCKETTTALFKSIATHVEHDPKRFFLLLECIEECKKDNSNFHLTLARASGSVLKLETLKITTHSLDVVVLAEALKGNSSVTKLKLPYQKIGHAGAAALAGALKENLSLKVLKLSHHNISDNGAAALAEGLKKSSSLTELDLASNEISDAGAAALAGALRENSSLTVLNLPHNKIGVAGAAALGGAFKENSSLTVLDLNLSEIGDFGATALFEGLRENSSLTRLELSGNSIGVDGAAALAKALSEKLSLKVLGLSTNHIGVAGAAALAETLSEKASLTVLDLSNNKISGAGAAAIAEVLGQISSLTVLDLSQNDIGGAGAAALAEGLSQNSSLTVLDLSANAIGDASAAALAEVLREKSSLTKLDLQSNNIGIAGSTALAEALKDNSSLTVFDLSFNGIQVAGATSLAEALRKNSSLRELELSYCDIGVAGAAALAGALRENTSLTLLKLSSNNIGFDGAAALAGALKENSSLTVLKLCDNDIGDAGAAALAEALRENSTLTRLKLTSNNITDASAAVLSEALRENTSLKELILHCNNFSDAVEHELRGMEHGDRIHV